MRAITRTAACATVLAGLTAVSISASQAATSDAALLKQAQGMFKPLPQNMGTDAFPITPERVELGRKLLVEAGEGGETAFRFRGRGNASTFAWIDRGFGFAVTAKANREKLLPIAEAVYHALAGGRGMPSKPG